MLALASLTKIKEGLIDFACLDTFAGGRLCICKSAHADQFGISSASGIHFPVPPEYSYSCLKIIIYVNIIDIAEVSL